MEPNIVSDTKSLGSLELLMDRERVHERIPDELTEVCPNYVQSEPISLTQKSLGDLDTYLEQLGLRYDVLRARIALQIAERRERQYYVRRFRGRNSD